jgi:hypothetical protein
MPHRHGEGAVRHPSAHANVTADADSRFDALYQRYVAALALLCECAPYVDEPDFADRIDALLDDAARHHPLQWQADGPRRALAPREGS